jgi:CBS domain-containing protein
MNARDIMTKDPACCMPDSKLTEVARMMMDHDCGQIPVIENQSTGKPVGVVTDRDIVIRAVAQGKNPLDMTAKDVMSSPAVTVTPDTRIEDCCQTLEDKQVRRVPVVDDRGRCCGMVSQADIAQHAPEKMTAEVVRTVSQPVHV